MATATRTRRRPISSESVRRKALQVAVIALFGVLCLLGVRDIVVGTFGGLLPGGSQASAVAAYPRDAAQAQAAQFALAYETFDSAHPEQRQRTLAAFGSGNDSTMGWDGAGRQTATQAMVAGIKVQDGGLARVTVAVQVDGARWIWLSVPVVAGQQNTIGIAGAPALISPPVKAMYQATPDPDADAALSDQLRPAVSAFLGAWASSNVTDLSYYAAPGVYFVGLGRAAELANLDNLTVFQGGPAARAAKVTVLWKDRASGATFAQSYSLQLRAASGRWLVASLAPNP